MAPVRQHSFIEIDHEIFSTVILSLPLILEGKLSVGGEWGAGEAPIVLLSDSTRQVTEVNPPPLLLSCQTQQDSICFPWSIFSNDYGDFKERVWFSHN